MEIWEEVFIGVTLGLVMAIAVANAVYLYCGKARRRWSKQRQSKSPVGKDES